jgi:solute carrier family 39 (zinc transporter), member 1/2/3
MSSVHICSLFESLALGMTSDSAATVLLAASIGLHQPAESFALLVTYLRTNMSKKNIMKWLALYSSMAPIGVLGGIIIQQVANPVIEGLIIAMTAGTFLYVGASEIVNEEFESGKTHEKYLKFFSFVSGIVLLGGLQYFSDKWEANI